MIYPHPDYDYCNCVDTWEHGEALKAESRVPKIILFCDRCSWDPCLCGEWERKYPPVPVQPPEPENPAPTLFNTGYFPLHAGGLSNYKIDCHHCPDDQRQTASV